MYSKRGFTLIELLVVISVIAILLGILMPALNKAREYGKRVTCLANLKSLTIGWTMYATANNEKILSGQLANANNNAPAWCGDAQPTKTEIQQKDAIRSGALFPYMKNINSYRCPTAQKYAYESYAIVDSMNGEGADLKQTSTPTKGLIYTSKNEIKNASSRMVFVDEAFITPSSYAIRYSREYWYDAPTVRHGLGDTWSFADCHAEFHKWSGRNTISLGKIRDFDKNSSNWTLGADSTPKNSDDQRDLQFVQVGCYGKLGYAPTSFGF